MAEDLTSILAYLARSCSHTSSTLILVLAPFRIRSLYHKNVKVHDSRSRLVKFFLGITLVASRVFALACSQKFKVALATHATAAMLLCLLSSLEHSRTLRPSTMITFYLLASLLSDIAEAFTTATATSHLLAQIACETAFLLVEARSKAHILKYEYKHHSSEVLSGVLSGALFCWVSNLIFHWQNKGIALDHLPELDPDCSSAVLREKIVDKWAGRAKPETKFTLLWVVLNFIRIELLYAAPCRLALIFFRYAQPMLIETAIKFVSQPMAGSQRLDNERCIVFATAFVYVGMALSSSVYQHALNRMKLMVRGAFICLIHNKSMTKRGVNSKKENEKAVALVSTDVDSLASVAEMLHEAWAQFIEVVIGLTLLTQRIGWISPVLLLSIFGCAQMSRYVAKHLGPKQKAWNEATQERMIVTTEVINQAKTVKMAGMVSSITAAISKLRHIEIEKSKRLRWIMVYYNASANALGIFSPAIVLILYALLAIRQNSSGLDSRTAFTATALLALVTHPANMIMTIVPRAVAAQVGFERIQSFLLERDMPDDRKFSPYTSPGERNDCKFAARFEKLTICFTPALPPVLERVDLELNPGCVTLCLGAVGSGKSAMVRAILGDMVLSTGLLEISAYRIAVCMQTPWLPNGTIQQAICGMSHQQSYDSEWYDSVVRACCLDIDFEALPKSDTTQIGYCGINLSGGQRQRVALARAVYSRCEIVVLDDPFSSVDRTTEDCIVRNLFGPDGLLRRNRVTSFVTTNAARHLSFADHIVILEDSKVKMQGSLTQLREQKLLGSEDYMIMERNQPQSSLLHIEAKLRGQSQSVAEASNDAERMAGDIGTYSHYFLAAGFANCWMLAACTASYSFFITIPQYWLKCWTESKSGSESYYIWGYIILSLTAWISTNGTMWTTHLRVAPSSGTVLHDSLLRITMGAAQSFFFKTDSAVTVNRFGQDMYLVDRELPTAFGNLSNRMDTLAPLVLLLSVQLKLLAILPIGMGILYLVQKVYLQQSRQLRLLDLEHRAGVYSSFIETTEGIVTIRAFGWEDFCSRQHCRYLDNCQRPYYILMCLQRWLNITMDLLASGVAVAVIALLLTFRRTVTGAQIGIAFNIILLMNTTLLRLIESWTNLELTMGAISRLKQFQTETQQEDSPLEDLHPINSWPPSGAISIQNIQVSYNPKATALYNCSLNIEAGQKVVICGRTGSGKSTMLLALLKLLELQCGSIKIDGINITRVPRRILRERCFITLPQDPFIMPNLTLRLHVDPEQSHSNEQVIEVLDAVQLWAHLSPPKSTEKDKTPAIFEIRDLKHHILDQPLNVLPSLSSGQMQLLSFARAALQSERPVQILFGNWPRPVLLVDEATSSLDTKSEELALDLIERYFTRKGLTVIMVTHKLDAVVKTLRKHIDCIVTMEAGRIRKVERVE